MPAASAKPDAGDAIQRMLRRVRSHLGLDVSFVSELTADARVFRYVDADGTDIPIRVGDQDPRQESYCHYVASGALPELVRDATQHPVTAHMAVTEQLGIGTYVSVPIVLGDGTVYGLLCAFATRVSECVDESQLAGMRLVADVVADYVDEASAARRDVEHRRQRLRDAAHGGDLTVVGQPILALASREVVGVEALTRFPALCCGPAGVFSEAWQLGMGVELELAAVDAAIAALGALVDDVYLAVNVSPTTLVDAGFAQRTAALPAGRLVAEITEHHVAVDDDVLARVRNELGGHGARLAIDDVGTGFSSLTRLLRFEPAILKIAKSLVDGIDESLARQALVSGLAVFAQHVGITTVAEGIETAEQAAVLQALGIDHGQGFHFAVPCKPAQLTVLAPTRRA